MTTMTVTVKFEAKTIDGLRTLLELLDTDLRIKKHERVVRVLLNGEIFGNVNPCGCYALQVVSVDK